jgi:hypothetical protein
LIVPVKPFFIHGNGHTFLDSTLELIGYKNVKINDELSKKYKKLYIIITYFNDLIYILIFIVLFIYIIKKKHK